MCLCACGGGREGEQVEQEMFTLKNVCQKTDKNRARCPDREFKTISALPVIDTHCEAKNTRMTVSKLALLKKKKKSIMQLPAYRFLKLRDNIIPPETF